ncbi:hypothetical protein [Streptomyces sp. NPDC097610]|uniref:hypothetical protein n=1 Tax=Streptomyces sp. NPDC097610 TaxID=3157227 RepID=UPI0033312408
MTEPMTEPTTLRPGGGTAGDPAHLAAAMAEAARTADTYRANATKARDRYRGAPDRAWLTSQSAVCTARHKQCAELARRDDRDAPKWQTLALGYAGAAAVLARHWAEGEGTAAALQAAAELLKDGASLQARAISAAPAYVNLEALNVAYREARDHRAARVIHTVEVEMRLLACYARDHNPALMAVAAEALDILEIARANRLPADVTEALDAVGAVLREALLDPSLNSD